MNMEYKFYNRLSSVFPSQVMVDVTQVCNLSCIHCPHQLNLCIGCQGKLTDGEFTLPTHKHDHLFQIFFESSYPEPAYPPLMEDSEGGWINLFNQQFTT